METETLFSPVVPSLVELSKEFQMVVVGSRGRGPLIRSVLGSVSSSLIRHSHCPVAVIHDEDPLMPQPVRAPVLVGIDGSPVSELATAIAFDEASRRGVELIAMHVWSDVEVNDYPAIDWPAMKPAADEVLAERLAGWQERYPDVAVRRVVECDHPTYHLIQQAESAQLVVVGSHGRDAAGIGQHGGGSLGPDTGHRRASVIAQVRLPNCAVHRGPPGRRRVRKRRSTSSRLQVAVPGIISIAASAATPKQTDFDSGHPRLSPTVIAATIASRAPLPLPERIVTAGMRWIACAVTSSAPWPPSDTTTTRAPPS